MIDPIRSRGRQPLEAYLTRVGQRWRPFTDLYAFLLRASWTRVVLLAALVYGSVNVVFALLYWSWPGCLANSDNSYLDALYFSVQTFGSIGYGAMYPLNGWANAVVVVENFLSLFCIALLTGIVFSKFSRPHARVLFSRPILIEMRDGVPMLTFRCANERGNDVVEASMTVNVMMTVNTEEGKRMRRFFPLALERSSSPIFLMSWQLFHPIDEKSPLYGITHARMIEDDVRFIVGLTGLDGTFAQTIHARHIYWAEDVLVGHRFIDVIDNLPNGVARLDFRRLHDSVLEAPIDLRRKPS